jgi:hypothetical protein
VETLRFECWKNLVQEITAKKTSVIFYIARSENGMLNIS